MPARTVRRLTGMVVATTLAIGTCTAAEPVASPNATASTGAVAVRRPDGLRASLVQYRRDQQRRQVQVKLANTTGSVLGITLVDVSLPGFASTGPVNRTTVQEDGRRVDLPVPLGAAVCDGARDAAASARVDLTGPDGETVRSTVPIDDNGLLDRLHALDCGVRRAQEAADIALAPVWRRRGQDRDLTVSGEVTVALRDPAAVVEISAIAGGLLFVIEPGSVSPAPPVRVDRAHPRATVGFTLVPARCDGHAIAEARRLTTVGVMVAVDGQPAAPVRRAPDAAGFGALVSALNERCAAG